MTAAKKPGSDPLFSRQSESEQSDRCQLTVFYDGSCPRCIRDRQNYEKLAGENAKQVQWLDITGRDEELRELGIDPRKALTELHIKTGDGEIRSELDAYITLMQRTRLLKPLAWLLGLPLLRPLLSRWYHRSVTRRLQREGRW